MLTKYDEFPVHQSPYPFSRIPITDYSFDDGFYFGFFCPDEKLFLFAGMRVNPNADMIGGYAGVMREGVQYTVRMKRPWSPRHETVIGPYSLDVVEAFTDLHLALGANDSELSFDLHWLGAGPPFTEAHHFATNRQRVTTDQTRYTQPGRASGWIEFAGRRFEVHPDRWYASRDHSWGLYYERTPLAPDRRWMRPRERGQRRSLRLWTVFATPTTAGFFSVHEAADGSRGGLNDTFGTPFEGYITPDGTEVVELVDIAHRAEFEPGSRVMRTVGAELTDANGDIWAIDHVAAQPPWYPQTIGYDAGSWRDGGSMYTYAGTDEPVLEFDEFDLSSQPFDFATHDGRELKDRTGLEYLVSVQVTAPDGTTASGAGQTELFVWSDYEPWFAEEVR